MIPEKEEELRSICPAIFPNYIQFACGDGWFDLLRELITSLRNIVDKAPTDPEFPCAVSQVKEKYGALRFYMNCSTDEMENAIDEAEDKSAKTCEECGAAGSFKVRGNWYYTRCDECWNGT